MAEKNRDETVVCVTGGSGFVGKHLLKILKKDKGIRIKVLSRNAINQLDILGNVQIVKGNLLNLDSLIRFLEPNAIIVNLAYLTNQPKEENLKAMENLSEACKIVSVARLIHCSTSVVVGNVVDDVVTETTVCKPVSEYEITKFEIENLLIRNLKGICPVTIVRPTTIFGEGGKNLLKHAQELITESHFKKIIKTSLYARRRLNLVYVENVATAIWFLARLNANIDGQCFIVSDDDVPENNYQDVMALLSKHFGLRQTFVFPLPFRKLILSILLITTRHTNTNPKRVYSCEKLILAGFKKPVSFEDGVNLFAKWYKHVQKGQI